MYIISMNSSQWSAQPGVAVGEHQPKAGEAIKEPAGHERQSNIGHRWAFSSRHAEIGRLSVSAEAIVDADRHARIAHRVPEGVVAELTKCSTRPGIQDHSPELEVLDTTDELDPGIGRACRRNLPQTQQPVGRMRR